MNKHTISSVHQSSTSESADARFACNHLLKALCDAIARHDLLGMKKALNEGANPNGHDKKACLRPPMMEAAAFDFVDGLDLLHQHGALIDGPTDYSQATPLVAACGNNRLDAAQWLLRHGAGTREICTPRQPSSEVALGEAISLGVACETTSMAQILIDAFPDLQTEKIVSITAKNISNRIDPQMARWLLEKGVSPNIRRNQGDPWLILAQLENDLSLPITEVLLDAGCDVNLQGVSNWTALHYAVRFNSPKIFLRLLQAGADSDLSNDDGMSVRSLLKTRQDRSEMLALFEAWEASAAAYQAINGETAPARINPL